MNSPFSASMSAARMASSLVSRLWIGSGIGMAPDDFVGGAMLAQGRPQSSRVLRHLCRWWWATVRALCMATGVSPERVRPETLLIG
jgi:hypothetical protein